jgi:signal transduction histidine kinase
MKNKNIDFNIYADESYAKVYIASSISQVVLNLINNSKDALEEVEKKEILVQFLVNESGVEIECCDTGSGVDQSIKEKIFNPYFTTKEKTQGTGIGLYMSKEIIYKIFDGQINISSRSLSRSTLYPSSNLEKTCFFIALPYSKNCYIKEDKL